MKKLSIINGGYSMKKLTLCLLSLISFGSLYSANLDMSVQSAFYQVYKLDKNTVLCFDGHDCTMDNSNSMRIKGALSNPRLFPIFLPKTIHWAIMNRKKQCFEWAHMDKDGNCNSKDIVTLNPYVPSDSMIAAISALKSVGVKVCFCSNLGLHSLLKYSQDYPEYFGKDGVFDYYSIGGFSGTKDELSTALDKLKAMSQEERNKIYVNKKNPEAFKRCRDMVLEKSGIAEENLKLMMIDDSPKKLEIAVKEGFIPCLFKGQFDFVNGINSHSDRFGFRFNDFAS